MEQHEFEFVSYVTSLATISRRKNGPPVPDGAGLFDLAGVAEICDRRQCQVAFASEFAATVTFKEKKVTLTALGPDLYHPVSIIEACSKAKGRRTFDIDDGTVRPTNDGGIDELKLARVLAAEGIRPYLSKKGQYRREGDFVGRPLNAQGRELMRNGYMPIEDIDPATKGMQTWTFLQVLNISDPIAHRSSHDVRRALRALEDAGLVRIQPGPRGGMTTAKISFTERAFLPKPTTRPTAFEEDDEMAMEAMGAGVL